MSRAQQFAKRFRVRNGRTFRLKDVKPDDTWPIKSRKQAERWLERGVARLAQLQEKLYAQDSWGLAVDLSGDGRGREGRDDQARHVRGEPAGVSGVLFKSPSAEELDHDFLWRTSRCLPERGRIGIFNRSYYEETLVVRVHPKALDTQKLPASLVTRRIWNERFEDIAAFERYATRNGIAIRKFFLHVSRKEQKRRFLRRLDLKSKNWKFSAADAKEREHWGKYMRAYEETIRHTSSDHAPWYVVPADHKWFTRLVVVEAVIDALEEMELAFPKVDRDKRKELAAVRARLDHEP